MVTNSIFADNIAGQDGFGDGGAIANYASLTVSDSTFSDNISPPFGVGGIYNSFGTATVTNSTFTGNNASALYNSHRGTMTVENSTISNNTGIFGGGGISNWGMLSIFNSTLSDNDAGGFGNGGSIVNYGTLNMSNTILANSTSGEDCYNYYGDVIATNISNLIETNGPAGHMCGTPALSADPMLGPLADNVGPTQTMALLAGSPAIDAGDDATCAATDQRGVARPQGAACDIGAFELKAGIDVSIDIKPGSDVNPINLNSKGKIPVVILSTLDFDAPSIVDVSSLTFGRTGDEESLAFCNENGEDVNGDGLLDLVCHFDTQLAGFQSGDLEGVLKGETLDGTPIEGRDVLTVLD